ncbi:MAG: hypothetical protein V2J08_05720 [Desulfotignum sp.]|jgi:hypothetical protein|nr:hypothetical protein [Desulfotignum sp.]
MTTIPGHNQIIQQSGIAQEISQQAHSLKPSPDQAAVQQQAQELRKNSSVLASDESERLKKKKEKQDKQKRGQQDDQRRQTGRTKAAQHASRLEQDLDLDPDAPGRILDTTV